MMDKRRAWLYITMMDKRRAWLYIARKYFDWRNDEPEYAPRLVTNGLCWAVKVLNWQNLITHQVREDMLFQLMEVKPCNDFWCARGKRNAHLRSTIALFLAEGMAPCK